MSDIELDMCRQALSELSYAANTQAAEDKATIAYLRARVAELEEGLRFYAAWPQGPAGNIAPLLLDAGCIARAALNEEEAADDGQPDEAQEWEDYDPDC